MSCCKYVVVKFSHEQRTCFLASGQRMLFGSYRTLAREDADAVLATVETDGRSIRSIVAHVVGYFAKRVGIAGAAGHAVNLLYGNHVGADALQYLGYALVVEFLVHTNAMLYVVGSYAQLAWQLGCAGLSLQRNGCSNCSGQQKREQ